MKRSQLLAMPLLLWGSIAGAQALHDIVTKGATDRSVTVKIIDSATGVPSTDIVFNSSGIDLWYRREGAASTDVTEATLAALTTAHTDGGFLHVNDGVYRLDLPDAAFATGANYVDFGGIVTGEIVIGGRVKLVNANLEDSVRLGLTALPNAAADAAGGLPISDAGGLDLDDDSADIEAILVDTGTTLDDFLDTEVAAILSDTNAILVDTGTTLDDFLDTEIADILTDTSTTLDDFIDTEIADIRRAIGPASTTIASLASQTSFTLTAGSADDNAYNGYGIVIVDASTAAQTALGCISDYTGTTKTVTLRSDPAIFTMATSDIAILLPSFCTTGVDVSTIETVDATDQLDAHAAAGLDAAGVRAALGMAAADLDTQLDAIVADTNEVQISLAAGGLIESMVDDLQAEVDGIQADTEDLQSRTPAALVSGRMDASVGAMAANVVTAAAVANGAIDAATFAADVDAEILSYIVDDATRIDASELNADVDSLVFTKANELDVNVQSVNGVTLTGDGSGTPFNVVSFRGFKRAHPDVDIKRAEFRRYRDRAVQQVVEQYRVVEASL